MKKLILLGYMGSGKSTIGKVVAEKLAMEFIDLDHYIENKEQQTIREIFKQRGEIYFRKIEHQYLHELLNSKNTFVLSLGGGTPCYANNHLVLQNEEVTSVYLKGSIETLAARLQNEKEHRPVLITHTEDTLETFIAKNLFDRSYFYHQAKHYITIDNKSIEQIATEVIAQCSL